MYLVRYLPTDNLGLTPKVHASNFKAQSPLFLTVVI